MTPSQSTRSILAVAALVTAGSVSANENPGAHQHGHAELQLAIQGNQIDLMFTSPAYNLLGFEHRARTEDQKALVAETTEWLGETALVDTANTGCTVMNAVVHHQAGGDDGGHDHGHDHDHDHDHDHKEEPSHSDFEVSQTLTCPGLRSSEPFSTPLTTRFPEIEHLGIEWVWSEGQGSDRLDQGESNFRLSAQ